MVGGDDGGREAHREGARTGEATGLKVVLVSTYELGRQPFGIASPAAWLKREGATVRTLDLAVERLDEASVAEADLLALYVPMHTASRMATGLAPRLRELNPRAHMCFYGLYAPMNETLFRRLGAQTILGGEFEEGLVSLYRRLLAGEQDGEQPEPRVSTSKQVFIAPERDGLPALDRYAKLLMPGGEERVVGYTEATRGCKHVCRHCPVVPVYNGRFRPVGRDVVLEDIRRQVAAGAQHITFGDPDFLNGPGHAIPIVEALHEEFPDLTYDATIKVEHLVKHERHLPTLKETGCLFVTSAVESVDPLILEYFDKRHTREEFRHVVETCRRIGLALSPTFVTFTPWTTLRGYIELLETIRDLDIIPNVAPIQYAIRLLIPNGSRLLELPVVQELVDEFDEQALCYRWTHPDPRVDELHAQVLQVVQAIPPGESRHETFARVWRIAMRAYGEEIEDEIQRTEHDSAADRATVPRLNEPWYC